MKIANYILEGAEEILKFERIPNLPQEIKKSGFYLAEMDDSSIQAFGSIQYEKKEYKIGPKKSN